MDALKADLEQAGIACSAVYTVAISEPLLNFTAIPANIHITVFDDGDVTLSARDVLLEPVDWLALAIVAKAVGMVPR